MRKKCIHSGARLFALFCVLTLAYTNAWAGGGYTVKLTASANPNDAGTVYVVKYGEGGNNVSAATASYAGSTTSTKSAYEVFAVYANAKRGKKFTGWSNLSATWTESGTTPKSYVKQDGDSWVTDSDGASKNPTYIQLRSSTRDDYYNLWVVQYDRAESTTGTITANFGDNDIAPWYVQYLVPEHGTYTVKGPDGPPAYGTVTLGGAAMLTYNEDQIELNATPAAGYAFTRYIGEDEEGNVVTLGEVALKKQTIQIPIGIVKVSAEFTQQPFLIGERTFANLDAALQAVKTTTSKTILLLQDGYTVPAGNYTIPSGVTLLIPKSDLHVAPEPTIERVNASSNPLKFRKLILANGVNINVSGTIELGGTQGGGAQGATGAGIPTATYGQLQMNEGSKITLNNGAVLRSWGFVTGKGEIDARRGSVVYEQFQNYDWKGGSNVLDIIGNSQKVFPVNTYFIQNIESPVTYHPGSKLMTVTCVYVSGNFASSNSVQIVGVDGDIAMFLMDNADNSEDTWVRKWYDTDKDFQVYEINSSARLGSMEIYLPNVPVSFRGISLPPQDVRLNSADYVLPVTSNLKIHLLTGEMQITQNTVMLPGAEIEIDKTSTVIINAGQSLYLYDSDQWGKYVFQDREANQIRYTASANGTPNKRRLTSAGLGDAKINVHGTFEIEYNSSTKKSGAICTTAGGANIFSTIADAGTIQFSAAALASDKTSSVYAWGNTAKFVEAKCPSAWLKNDAGSTYSDGDGFSETAGTAAGQSFCFIDIDSDGKGEWVNLTTDGCFVYDQNGVYYAKPADYVALKNGKTENADHTYSSADGSRTLILISGECQWWEVEYQEESGLYFCEKNGIYYYYDEEEEWIPKTFKITWQNWDGSILKDEDGFNIIYEVPYGSTPKYNNSTPSRPDDPGYYTYDFTGWSPEFTPVTQDVIYIAQYERNPVMYTITWKNANGTEREVGYFQRDEMPVCRTQPADMSALEWVPAVSAVTGNATYQLHERNVDGPFDIKFLNWDGTQIGTTQSVAKNTMPTVPASTPVKPAIDDVEFVFTGWNPEVVAATANTTYTALFEERLITYAITWQNWDGTELKKDDVTPNTVPQYTGTMPVKAEDADNAYVFNSWSPTIVAATTDATYTATYTAVPKDMEVGGGFGDRVLPGAVTTVTNMIVHSDGTLTVPNTATLKAANLILEATESTSGQVLVNPGYESRLQVAGTAYFDLTLNTPSRHWHAFGVPWRVDIDETPLKEVETGRTLTLGRDYDIIYYNGATRASQGPGAHCWEYVVDNGKTLSPGQGYMIAFASPVQTVRFTKAAGAPIIFNGSNSVTGGSGDDGGWNAIANPMAYHATLNAGPTVGYVHDGGEIGSDGYVPYDIDNKKYIVGKAVYVQASEDATVAVAAAGSKGVITPVAAPARRAKATDKAYLALEDYYRVSLADAAGVTGNVYVLNEEDKADQYIIGHDLSQFGMNATKPQIWVNRYGVKLALNTTAPIDGVAEFPVSLYAPKDGEYTISLQSSDLSAQESEALYLTKDGEVIRNLSDGAYTTVLTKGTISGYTLRLGEKKAPEVATGFGEAIIDAHGKTTKVLIDGKVFIIREDRVYTIDGQLVK